MDAATMQATAQAGSIGTTTPTALKIGRASAGATTGSGPIAASTNQALLGQQVLPAPAGEPQPIHLPDGSILVPVARIDDYGNRVPLAGGAGSAPMFGNLAGSALNYATGSTATAIRSSAADSGGGIMRVAEGAQLSSGGQALASGSFEPLGMLYNGNYYKRYFDGGELDVNDRQKLEERATESTFLYLKDKEPEVDDFGITGITLRPVDPTLDADLLNVNPRAMWVVEVHGVQGNGVQRMIPSVINADGATFTDPRIRGGG